MSNQIENLIYSPGLVRVRYNNEDTIKTFNKIMEHPNIRAPSTAVRPLKTEPFCSIISRPPKVGVPLKIEGHSGLIHTE